ncbi:MAG TPA: hypothetical protein VKQ36_10720, partial [Ktedonobacterales bacterium]|nr:hypothetical protein [Ktedonobacterales bacterium]
MSITIARSNASPRLHGLRQITGWLGSVRVRLTLWYLAILTLVLLVFGVAFATTVAQKSQGQEQSALILTSQQVASTYSASDGLLHLDKLARVQSPPMVKPGVFSPQKSVRVYPLGSTSIVLLLDSRGEVVQSVGSLTSDAIVTLQKNFVTPNSVSGEEPLPAFEDVALTVTGSMSNGSTTTIPYIVYMSRLTNQQQNDYLLVGQPNEFSEAIKRYMPELLGASLLTLLVAALGGYWLAARAMRPV